MEVASITGHKDLRMLQRYTHLRAEDLAKKLGETCADCIRYLRGMIRVDMPELQSDFFTIRISLMICVILSHTIGTRHIDMLGEGRFEGPKLRRSYW